MDTRSCRGVVAYDVFLADCPARTTLSLVADQQEDADSDAAQAGIQQTG